MYYTLFSLS